MSLRSLPFRSKLALMFVSVCVATFGVGGCLVASSARGTLEREIVDRLDSLSYAYATALDAHMQMLARRCEDFGSDGFIRDAAEGMLHQSAGAQREDLRAHLLRNKLPLEPAFVDLTVLGPRGEVLVTGHVPPPPVLMRQLATQDLGPVARYSGLLPGAGLPGARLPQDAGLPPGAGLPGETSDGRARLAIAVPIDSRKHQTRVGILVAWIHPARWILDALRSTVGEGKAAPGRVVLRVSDDAGQTLRVDTDLITTSTSSDLAGSGITLELTSGPDASSVTSDTFRRSFPVSANGWSVEVELGGEDIYSSIAGLQSRFVGIGILLSLAACVLFLLPMSFLTRPLQRLTKAARELASGDVHARVTEYADDEFVWR